MVSHWSMVSASILFFLSGWTIGLVPSELHRIVHSSKYYEVTCNVEKIESYVSASGKSRRYRLHLKVDSPVVDFNVITQKGDLSSVGALLMFEKTRVVGDQFQGYAFENKRVVGFTSLSAALSIVIRAACLIFCGVVVRNHFWPRTGEKKPA